MLKYLLSITIQIIFQNANTKLLYVAITDERPSWYTKQNKNSSNIFIIVDNFSSEQQIIHLGDKFTTLMSVYQVNVVMRSNNFFLQHFWVTTLLLSF